MTLAQEMVPNKEVVRLEVKELSKSFEKTQALKNVSFHAEPGDFVVLLGPSGSGKTTLLRCIAGIERISGGEIRFGNTTVSSANRHISPEYRELSMVFQDYALWPHMTAIENVSFALRRKKIQKTLILKTAKEILERIGLGQLTDRYPSDLSGGEQQRVALARALVAGSGLLLFDEPLSNLDADLRERLRIEIATMTRETGATVVYITHDQSEAFALADRIGVLERGQLVQFGTPEEIYRSPATPFVARFTGLAGELPGAALGPSGYGGLSVKLGSHLLTAQVGHGAFISDTSPGRLFVRSSALSLLQETSQADHMPAVVCDVAFRGRGYDHVVEVLGGHRLAGIFHPNKHDRGTKVAIQFDSNGCLFFPESAIS